MDTGASVNFSLPVCGSLIPRMQWVMYPGGAYISHVSLKSTNQKLDVFAWRDSIVSGL